MTIQEKAIEQLERISNHLSSIGETEDYTDIAIQALEQEQSVDCISRKQVIKLFEQRFIELQKVHQQDKQLGVNWCINTIKDMPSVKQEQKTDYKAFAEWVADEIFSDEWEFNKDGFEEIACRKLSKLGLVKADGDKWVRMERSDEKLKNNG